MPRALSVSLHFLLLLLYVVVVSLSSSSASASELGALMALKASLDPDSHVLTSWAPSSDPCSNGAFEGVACDDLGRVVNISLQGKGLTGRIPSAIAGLKSLTGLYLHFNSLTGNIPPEITSLTQLADLYLNVNNLSGEIPRSFGNMPNLQVLQLCYNGLIGSIPTQLGNMERIGVLALQYNRLTGAIPASLGELKMLSRLDLSFNRLFGSVPAKLLEAPLLEVLDIRNNSLSGAVPQAFKRLKGGFQYRDNLHLCGVGFPNLRVCSANDAWDPNRPEPYQPHSVSTDDLLPNSSQNRSTGDLPESANLHSEKTSKSPPRIGVVLGAIGLFVAFVVSALFSFSWYRRRKQKIGSAFDGSDTRLSIDQAKEVYRKSASPLISLEYSNGWDPVAKGRGGGGGSSGFSQEFLESFVFNLEEVERATQCFSEASLLGKSNFSAVYKGVLRDGSSCAVKCIAKTSCKSDESEFLKGLKILTSLRHENLVRLRGFCCSKGRGECFLVYDFVANGSLLQYLDSATVLEWSTRVSIIYGIAKGIAYLHGNNGNNKHDMAHRNISAEKVLIDDNYRPVISDSGLHKLLADDIVFSMLKASAAMGYLAPEYTTTGRFTGKSDVYAFGVIVFQILTGKRIISQAARQGAESSRFEDFVDRNLEQKFSESEADRLGKLALLCTHESPNHRPSMNDVMQELSVFVSS